MNRVATTQGKQGIWMYIFPDRENTGNLPNNIKKCIWRTLSFVEGVGVEVPFDYSSCRTSDLR